MSYSIVIDFAAVAVPEPHEEFEKGILSSTAFADDAYDLAFFGVHSDVV